MTVQHAYMLNPYLHAWFLSLWIVFLFVLHRCRCEEVKKEEKETVGRLTVEEAISAAKIRHCYKCNQPFVKSEGCNKITCSCGAKQCYVCRQAVSDYTHYCQTFECKHAVRLLSIVV
jgi:hypothetical protein